jgi:hypothetical protein
VIGRGLIERYLDVTHVNTRSAALDGGAGAAR